MHHTFFILYFYYFSFHLWFQSNIIKMKNNQYVQNLSDWDYCITVSFLELVILMNPLIFHPHMPFKAKPNHSTCGKNRYVFVLNSPCFCASCSLSSQVNLALKQKSDIEHYRNKLRLKAKRKGYYDFPSTDGSSSGRALAQRQRHGHERAAGEHGRPLEPDDERGSTYVKSHRRWGESGKASGTWVWLSGKENT